MYGRRHAWRDVRVSNEPGKDRIRQAGMLASFCAPDFGLIGRMPATEKPEVSRCPGHGDGAIMKNLKIC